MKILKDIFIIRHGETDLNKQGIVQGSGVDAPLNDFGRRQSRAFFEQYRHQPFEVVLTSHLKRTHETVAPFVAQGVPWEQFAEINEISWGNQEGQKSEPWMVQLYREVVNEWSSGNLHARIEQGESAAEMGTRLQVFVDHLKERPEHKILVCSHGRAMRGLMCLLREQSLTKMDRYHHANTGLYQVIYQADGFRFHLENDISHLENLEATSYE